ncbi:hypothetical protein Bca4012_024001 [Brassica carinata]
MGQDYSYTQPSSSEEFDINSLLEAEAALYADEGVAVGHVNQVTGCESVLSVGSSESKSRVVLRNLL